MSLEEMNGGTILTLDVYANLKGFMKLFDSLLEKQVCKSLTTDLNRLKENFESGKI